MVTVTASEASGRQDYHWLSSWSHCPNLDLELRPSLRQLASYSGRAGDSGYWPVTVTGPGPVRPLALRVRASSASDLNILGAGCPGPGRGLASSSRAWQELETQAVGAGRSGLGRWAGETDSEAIESELLRLTWRLSADGDSG
jgi:hypothetical protein